MAKEKKKKLPFWERWMWWTQVFGCIFTLGSIIPVVPWRYARVDTNVGNRFVMERYYTMMGATNNVGKTESWLSLRMKMKRKVEEFGRPSPLLAIMGTVTQSLGTGGAAMGCPMWMVCKEHVNSRFLAYSTVGYSAIGMLVCMIISCLFAVASIIYLGFEQDAYGKKKKKKKKDDDECLTPTGKTAAFATTAFTLNFCCVTGFVCLLGMTLQGFKRTAYYPFAASHAAPFAGWFGTFMLFQGCCIALNRQFQCCAKSKKDEDDNGEGGAMGYGGGPPGYGMPPPGYGMPPPGYGMPPPGGKGK